VDNLPARETSCEAVLSYQRETHFHFFIPSTPARDVDDKSKACFPRFIFISNFVAPQRGARRQRSLIIAMTSLTEYVSATDRPPPLFLTVIGSILWRCGILQLIEIPHPHAGSPSRRLYFGIWSKARKRQLPSGENTVGLGIHRVVGYQPVKPTCC
jgi:hypothetical protein